MGVGTVGICARFHIIFGSANQFGSAIAIKRWRRNEESFTQKKKKNRRNKE